ncbi:hypothetical protein [Streptomyces scabiei]|uniref:hypothetical protein n=1 Tax=Streptomyces scabiei TaxID=1930 RepID=UPI0029B58882|nr:hypothetical protein [Streptomyces scabiei]MDX3283519.1 hypothetical protein [Streptomyces scabiei]MDX3283523.1 hypothetical protein [Streptomyces scabiei]
MLSSATKVHAVPLSRTSATVVQLSVSGENATVDMGENPAYHAPAQVAQLEISYRTTETFRGSTATAKSEVTGITFWITGKDYDTASVHPDFLGQPAEWPAWVRDLVSEYDPAG